MIGITHVKTQHLISLPVELAVEDQLSIEMYIVHPKALFIPVDVAEFKLLFVFVRVLLLRLLNMLLNVTKLCMFLLMLENNPYNYCYLFQNHGIRRCLCE